MNNLIAMYINSLTVEKVDEFAKSKNINLNNDELFFVYDFIKNNYRKVLANKENFDISQYQNKFSKENYPKVKALFDEYYNKFQHLL